MTFNKKNPLFIFVALSFLCLCPHFVLATTDLPLNQRGVSGSLKQNIKPLALNFKQTPIYKILIESKNKKLNKFIQSKQIEHKYKVFSKNIEEEIRTHLNHLLREKKILLPNTVSPLFSFSKEGLVISYKLKNPYQYGFVIKGNKNIPRYNLIAGKVLEKHFNNPRLIQKILSHIQEFYFKKGYAKASLNYTIKTDEKHFIKTVFISINEGKRTKIKNFRVLGQFSRPPSYYIDFMKELSSPLIKKQIFYGPDVQKGITNLEHLLKNEGYLKAVVRSRVTDISPNKVQLDLILKEGPLTTITTIYFKGNKSFSTKELKHQLTLKEQGGLNFITLEQDTKNIVSFYKNAGFMNMELKDQENLIHYDKENQTVSLHFNIVEKEKIKISDIIIQGLSQTKKDFIKRHLHIKEGDILTSEKADKAVKALNRLGLFSSVNILSEKSQTDPRGHSLLVQVEERSPRSVRFGLGLNTKRILTARGFGEFSHRNISGKGRRLFSKLSLQSNVAEYFGTSLIPKYLEHQAVLNWTEPFLFQLPIMGQVYVSNSSTVFSKTNEISDIVNSTKINFLLKRKLLELLNVSWTPLSWEGRAEFKKSDFCEKNPFSSNCRGSSLYISSTKLSLSVDKRDHLLFSSQGFLSQIFMEYAYPLFISSDKIKFLKLELKHFDFQPLRKRWVWFNSFQGGMITNVSQEKDSGVPVSRAFILGGAQSLRGFDGLIQGERVPDKEELPIEHANTLVFNRSSFYFLVKTELRFSINDQFSTSVFYDGGLVTFSGRRFAKPYRHSAGFGLRYKTPLGPVAGYLAFKISPKKGELPLVPHLSFGSF